MSWTHREIRDDERGYSVEVLRKLCVTHFLQGKVNRDGFIWQAERYGMDNLKMLQVFAIKYEGRKATPQEIYDICN